jgi:putative transcriptional regulator
MNVKNAETVSNRVEYCRKKAHLTQAELASCVGVTRQTIMAIEKGDYVPSVLLAIKLADHFKLPIEKVFYI